MCKKLKIRKNTDGETRTLTRFSLDPKSSASTNSATSAILSSYHILIHFFQKLLNFSFQLAPVFYKLGPVDKNSNHYYFLPDFPALRVMISFLYNTPLPL
jgi:hypothetical protein